MARDTPAYEYFEILKRWKRISDIDEMEKLMRPLRNSSPLFNFLYEKTKELYSKMPLRKDGEISFLHPLNAVLNLQRATVEDDVILSAGLIHDYVEEKVDLYRDEHGIKEDSKGIKILDDYEEIAFKELESGLMEFAKKEEIDEEKIKNIISVIKLLTRHKRDFYYRSVSDIFTSKENGVKEMAIMVKLADRMHNILCLDCFGEEERIYQCFKNLFILNSSKKYLLEKFGPAVFTSKKINPLERLFNKCCKATYDAFVAICRTQINKGIGDIIPLLQLSFKKFAFEREGVMGVTRIQKKESHLFRLFQGVIRKYDSRLYHEWDKFNRRKENEIEYSKQFFIDFKFTKEQIQAIIDYKDAYALREIVTYLLYKPDYVIEGFAYSGFFKKM